MDTTKTFSVEGYLTSLNANKDNPLSVDCEFVIHSLGDVSWHNQTISKETAQKYMHTIINQPILCEYIPESYCGANDDNFGDHAVEEEYLRGTSIKIPVTKTIAIGVFNDAEIREVDGIDCLIGKGILWKDRYENCVGLIEEWVERGVRIMSSCEYAYSSYTIRDDGVEEVLNPIYTGHCVLGSEKRGNNPIVLPAFDASRLVSFNAAINRDIINTTNNEKDGDLMDNIFVKALNTSLGDKRDSIMSALENIMVASEFNTMWLSIYGIDDDAKTITYESYVDGDWKNFQMGYTVNEAGEYVFDYENKKEVEYEYTLVAKNSITSLNEKVTELEGEKGALNESLNAANEKIEQLQNDIINCGSDKVDLNDQIKQLNQRVAELEGYEAQVKEMQYNEKVDKANEEYKAKFERLNALDTFEGEEVQTLIKDTVVLNSESIEDVQKSFNAKLELSDILVAKATEKATAVQAPVVKELCGKKVNNLIPDKKINEDFFGFSK